MDYTNYRYGSSTKVNLHDLIRAGLTKGHGISFGFDETKRHELRSSTDGMVALFGGAGSGKSASIFSNALIGGHLPANFICFDPRGELSAISILSLTLQGFKIYYINPTGMLGLPKHQINPLDHLTISSTTLIPDTQKMALDFCPTPSGTRSNWAFDDARRWLTDLVLFDAERSGSASLSGVFELLQVMQGDLNTWCDYLEGMMNSRFSSVRTFAEEIMNLMKQAKESFTAPMGILQSSFAFMRDPLLQWTFSGSDVSTQWLSNRNKKIAIFVIWPIEYIDTQTAAIRCVIGSAIQNKLRTPNGQPVSVLIDEGGQLKRFPSVRELFTFGRGGGLESSMVAWQELSQIKAAFGDEAGEIIGSAQYRVFKGVRTIETARLVSDMAGTMTLEYDAALEQSNARRQKIQSANQIIAGGKLFQSIADLQHHKYAETHQTKQARKLLEPDEALNLPPSQMVAFASGLVEGPILGHWINHFERRDFAGKYLNNPYHGEQVQIKTLWGSKKLNVIEESVPASLEHLPQYQDGKWRYVEGYRPRT